MKKTVTLTSLIKAKNDLELFIKVDQMKRLKKLFDPTFDIKDINSRIEIKEDQLIIIKVAIQNANTNTIDDNSQPLNYSIYQLSKYNRKKSDLLTIQRRLEADDFLNNNKSLKDSLLEDIQELDDLMKKETDKKKKADYLSSKNKLKRSLSKVSLTSESHTTSIGIAVLEDLKNVEDIISQIKDKLTKANNETEVEVDIADEFEIIIK